MTALNNALPERACGFESHQGYLDASRSQDALPIMFRWVIRKVRDWYVGEYVPPRSYQGGSVSFVSQGYYERPRLAMAIDAAWAFCKRNWKWLVSTIIAVGLALLA